MKAVQLFLASLGVKIEPEQIENAFNQTKDALPRLARALDEMAETQKRIEAKLDRLMNEEGVIPSSVLTAPAPFVDSPKEAHRA